MLLTKEGCTLGVHRRCELVWPR